MLSLYRRHEADCPHKDKGRKYTKCSCPIHCDGEVDGQRVRKSMDTRDWARAMRNLGKYEDPTFGLRQCAQPGCQEMVERGRCARHTREISRAIAAYHDAHQDVCDGTRRNRRRVLRVFGDFTAGQGVANAHEVELEHLTGFRGIRNINPRTWTKELEILRHFFRFCLRNEWVYRNWAEEVPMPKNLKPSEKEPYSPQEVAKIIAACDVIGRGPYERLRARAVVLLLRYTALRISDVATLERNRVRGGEIFVRTTKNGKPVRLPVQADLQAALDVLPVPRGAKGQECPYYFWSGNGSRLAVIRDVTRTLGAAFKASGVAGACSHRFRHTLATEVLEMGGTFEEAADILGDSETIVRKHYAKWSAGRQARISDLLARIWHAKKPQPQVVKNEWDGLVDEMGFEQKDLAKKQ
jgi:site-specific recombinase XerD